MHPPRDFEISKNFFEKKIFAREWEIDLEVKEQV